MKTTLLAKTSISKLAPTEAQHRSALFLDVRSPAEFEESHIDGSVSLPLSDLVSEKVEKLATGKDACVLICGTGTRARQAAEKLLRDGLSNLQILEGGVQGWAAAGLPLNHGAKTMSLERQVRIAAGALVFIGALLGYFVHPVWIALPAFVGAGLVFAAITDTCAMGMFIARMPWNNRRPASSGTCCPAAK